MSNIYLYSAFHRRGHNVHGRKSTTYKLNFKLDKLLSLAQSPWLYRMKNHAHHVPSYFRPAPLLPAEVLIPPRSRPSPVQDHRAAAAFPRDLRQPGEDPAARAGLVEATVHPEGGEAQSGTFPPGAPAQGRQSLVKRGQMTRTRCEWD